MLVAAVLASVIGWQSEGGGPAPKADDPPAVSAEVRAEYAAMRDRADRTAEAQWRLAIWCEEHGLVDESRFHLSEVVQLDPGRDAAWKRLGYKRHRGRWMSDEQIAEAQAHVEAARKWAAEFKAIHRHIHGGRRRAEAEAALARVTDPDAVAPLYREFGDRSPTDQNLLIQVLGQIDGVEASKTLASLSVYGVSADVRRRATETLRGREPLEYADFLIALMPDLLRYEVRPVGGPGSPGVLFVEGERYNIRRFYAPPPPPNVAMAPGSMITYGPDGWPLVSQVTGILGSKDHGEVIGGTPMRVTETQVQTRFYSLRQMRGEALKAAGSAEVQLESDVAQVEAMNLARSQFRGLIARVLKDATGQSIGEEAKDWQSWFEAQTGYTRERRPTQKPTFDEVVPLAYKPYYGPAFNQVSFLRQSVPDS